MRRHRDEAWRPEVILRAAFGPSVQPGEATREPGPTSKMSPLPHAVGRQARAHAFLHRLKHGELTTRGHGLRPRGKRRVGQQAGCLKLKAAVGPGLRHRHVRVFQNRGHQDGLGRLRDISQVPQVPAR